MDCYILTDWTPMLNLSKLSKAMSRPVRWSREEDLPALIDAKSLQWFIRHDLREKLKPTLIDKQLLYDAEVLPMICNVYLEAREAWVLKWKQIEVAQKCEALIRIFAIVGIRALIYEQLGYERMKRPDAYRMLVQSYLTEEERKWSKEFPDEFYIQLDRIYGNEPTTSRNRPQYYAKFTRKYVYDPILDGEVLKALDYKNPANEKGNRAKRHHQFLNSEKWMIAMRSQIWQVIWLLKASANKRKYEENYSRLTGNSMQESLFDHLDRIQD